MINLFFDNDNKVKLLQFRTAYYKDDVGNKKQFKFSYLDREDITAIDILKDIEMEEKTFIIRTKSNLPFSTQRKIVIDNIQYVISSIYTEPDKNNNGMYRKKLLPFTYLVIKH